jgi:hypothetical protein
LDYEEFIARHGHQPHWIRASENNYYFNGDLRDALVGDTNGFSEVAICGRPAADIPLLVRDLWRVGLTVRPYRSEIKHDWMIESRRFIDAFGDDLDDFLRDAGFNAGRLPEEVDVWRGGIEPFEVMASARCWTVSYSVACAFAFQSKLWRTARTEQVARQLGLQEPLVLTRRVRREQIAAWIGGIEREVVLRKAALAIPARPVGSLCDWRRHRARRRDHSVA